MSKKIIFALVVVLIIGGYLVYARKIVAPHRCINTPIGADESLSCFTMFSGRFWMDTKSTHIEWYK